MTLNIKLAKTVRELVRLHPEQHNQMEWSTNPSLNPAENCGTSACLAGWTAAALGFTVKQVEDGEAGGGDDDGYVAIDYWAAGKLGLDNAGMYDLFYCYNNEVALERLDDKIEAAEAANG